MHRRIVVVGAVVALATAGLAAPAQAAVPHLSIVTVANPRPQLISGTETLLRIEQDRGKVRVSENGHDITSAFRRQADGSLLGLATGLRRGTNLIVATSAGRSAATLRIVDHPSTGPVFSGPQQHPFFCETTAFGLAPATQPDCSAPTVVTYQYKNSAGAFVPLADPAQRPADLVDATVGGRPVPYIIRIETGTIDRAVYQTAALYDGAAPSPLRQEAGWNGRLVYTFGGGCNGGYHQGSSTGGVVNDLFLAQGYAVASSTLNVLDQNCSTMLSAEAAMMVKEHFVDVYGPVRYTIGWGGSGGAIQQYDITDAYPGILDGIVPGVSFPDPLSTIGPVSDCKLLDLYFAGQPTFTPAQRQAVAGFPSYDTCTSWDATFANRISPTASCSAAIPVSARWDPVTNPDGVKCSLTQQLANQLGIDPATGFARSPLDNVGVQYGLSALKAGQLSLAQFIALNQGIGGFDVAGNHVAQRSVASFQALVTAYAEDILPAGSQGLRTTPVIDQRTDLDLAGFGNDIHTTQWSYAMRARLQQANGTSANQVIIENQPTADEVAAANVYELAAMDAWLANITGDHRARGAQQKVIEDKPAELGDGCYLSAADRIVTTLTYPATGACAAQYPVAKDTRLVAGAPLASNVLKCHLRPIDVNSYGVPLTAGDLVQLRTAFPQGVCDYRVPGVGQVRPIAPWLSYGDGSVGTFGHAPGPVPIR